MEGNNRIGEDPRTVDLEKETAARRCLCGELGPKSQPAATAQGCLPGTLIAAARHLQDAPDSATTYKGVPGIVFDQWAETCPIQSDLHSYIFIAFILTNQSSSITMSDHVKPNNQNSAIWTNKIVQIWIPHLHKNRPIRAGASNFFL